jgi:MYXO-CTERM domain-containing protein
MIKLICTIGMASLIAVASRADAVLIDNFDNGGGTVQAAAGGSDSDSSSATGIIGGTRALSIPGANPVSGIGNLTMAANPAASGLLSFSLDAATSGSAILTWDGNGAGLASADLTDGGTSSFFTFDILSIDQGNVTLVLTVVDGSAATGSRTVTGAGVGTQQFDFTSFSGSPDFEDIESITLEIQGEDASDLVLDQLFTSGDLNAPPAPEPSTLGLALLGLAALGRVARRKR